MVTKCGTINKGIIIAVVFLSLLVSEAHADKIREQVNIFITPCFDKLMAYKKFYPLVAYLKDKTGLEINLLVPKDMAELESAIKNRDADFVLQDPHMYLKFEDYFSMTSLLSTLSKSGQTVQQGVFITKKGNKINSIKDLKGKTVMFGPKLSSVKWLAPKLLLKENGINIDRDLKSYSHGMCCEDIAFTVFLGGVDAGVICEHFLDEHPQKQKELGIDAKQLTIIGKTHPVPSRILAAHKATSAVIVDKITLALLELDAKNPEHLKILHSAELGGFQKAKAQDYNQLRAMANTKQS